MGRHANGFLLAGVAVVGGSIWLFRDRAGLVPTVLGYPLLTFGLGLAAFAGASHWACSRNGECPMQV